MKPFVPGMEVDFGSDPNPDRLSEVFGPKPSASSSLLPLHSTETDSEDNTPLVEV